MRPRNAKYTHTLGDVLRHEISITSDFDIGGSVVPGCNGYLLGCGRRHGLSALRRELLCGGRRVSYEKFLVENSTPGGVNELGLKLLRERGFYGEWREVLEKVYERYNSMGKDGAR